MTTRTKPAKRTRPVPKPARSSHEVLTLAEAAAFLRVPEAAVQEATTPGGIPGRSIAGEWRYLKSALQDWLSGVVDRGGREAVLRLAGAFKDDPFLEEIAQETRDRRGRRTSGKAG